MKTDIEPKPVKKRTRKTVPKIGIKAAKAAPKEDDISSEAFAEPINLTEQESQMLNEAALFLINPGLVAKGLAWMGKPVEAAQGRLPESVKSIIAKTSEKAIEKALVAALSSLPKEMLTPNFEQNPSEASKRSSWIHRGITSVAGAATGLVGLPLLPLELPFTTVVILRGILDQARLYGHDINSTETRLEALMVFSLSPDGENKKTGSMSYFATRASFSRIAQKAISYSAAMSARELLMSFDRGAAPILVKLVSSVAEKFQMRVTQKVAAESVPIAGAFGGGALNYAFTDFFVSSARYHFGVRALEKKYGSARIQDMLKAKMEIARMI